MSQSKYVLVANDGTSHDLSRKTVFDTNRFDLVDLLEKGWRPVHETPIGQGPFWSEEHGEFLQFACVLILLVKD
jgi:hypothetical protein